ncbi:MAG: hypothetical protein K9J85_06135 [Desulfobacteraceae bacterium]|nr:hypothetical protein [Desulfobacteraceae bacterium]
MIRYLFYLIIVVLLVIIQTSVIPYMPPVFRFYDFLVPFAVYLSLYTPLGEGLVVLAAAGLVMDMFSGAPTGVYLITYLWVFLVFRRVGRWVGIKDHLLFSGLAVLGVLFQNLIFAMVVVAGSSRGFFTLQSLQIILLQVFWAVITAPFLWLAFKLCFADSGRRYGG